MPEKEEHHAEGDAGKPSATRDADLTVPENCQDSAPRDEQRADILQAARGRQDGDEAPRQPVSHDPANDGMPIPTPSLSGFRPSAWSRAILKAPS